MQSRLLTKYASHISAKRRLTVAPVSFHVVTTTTLIAVPSSSHCR